MNTNLFKHYSHCVSQSLSKGLSALLPNKIQMEQCLNALNSKLRSPKMWHAVSCAFCNASNIIAVGKLLCQHRQHWLDNHNVPTLFWCLLWGSNQLQPHRWMNRNFIRAFSTKGKTCHDCRFRGLVILCARGIKQVWLQEALTQNAEKVTFILTHIDICYWFLVHALLLFLIGMLVQNCGVFYFYFSVFANLPN